MKHTKLGCSDSTVSRTYMGCMGLGDPGKGQHSWTLNEERSHEITKYGLEQGVGLYDTAIGYQEGTSEQYVGCALRGFVGREEVTVTTKLTPRTKEKAEEGVNRQEHIERMLDRNPKNLGMNYVDLCIYRMWDYQILFYEVMDGLDRMVKAGETRYIGTSNCYAWQLAKANALAEKEGFAKFIFVQEHYNFMFHEEEREMIPCCRERNIALTPYSVLAGDRLLKRLGEISRRLEEDSYARLKYDGTAWQDQVVVGRIVELIDKYGVSMIEVALAWPLEKVVAPVAGMVKIHYMGNAVKAVDLSLISGEIECLEEAYAPHRLVRVTAQNT